VKETIEPGRGECRVYARAHPELVTLRTN
jgi:hypothetical protein